MDDGAIVDTLLAYLIYLFSIFFLELKYLFIYVEFVLDHLLAILYFLLNIYHFGFFLEKILFEF
jgi:hypothetical protein